MERGDFGIECDIHEVRTPFKFEALSRALQERIDGITQSVAEDIEREKRQPDRERGDQHQVGNDRREATPSEIMMPQLGVGGCTPSPMKLSPLRAGSRLEWPESPRRSGGRVCSAGDACAG